MRHLRVCLLLAALPALAFAQRAPASELDFVHGLSEYQRIREMLPNWIESRAQALVQARARAVAGMSGAADMAKRRELVRSRMIAAIGGLPERSPLNPKLVGTLERDGYRIEKIVFESQPRFYVTANLYVPTTGKPPYPAILYPLGHEQGAKAHLAWQQMLVTLARRGYVLLTWDPVGQGERMQFYDPDLGDTKLRASTTEHTVLGIQCLLVGDAMARYTIWDGLRALDYLLSRPEVDTRRVACTGNSGGGTHTAYLSALDGRIQVAAPSCYITSWHWMLKTLGPQDAEQVFPRWLADGLDYPDFLYAFAPKPYLMLSAIRDFFPIDGARETYREARRIYDNLSMFEADDGHGYTHPRRQAAYEFFGRWLKNAPDREPEKDIVPETPETLYCTPTGLVATSLGGEDVFTLNRERARRAVAARGNPSAAQVIESARKLSGFEALSGTAKVTPYGTITRSGYRIEKLVYESEPGILIPALLYVPEGGAARKPAVIVADGRGKSAAAAEHEQLARAGKVVLAIDVRGLGETRPALDLNASDFVRYFGDYEDAMTGILMGRTIPALRAADILGGVDLLAARPEVDAARISGLGREAAAVPMLYAATFDKRIRAAALENMLVSYRSVVENRIHRQVFESIVPGALKSYDLPDLAAAISPRPVWIVDPASPMGVPLDRAAAAREWTRGEVMHRGPGDTDAARFYRELF